MNSMASITFSYNSAPESFLLPPGNGVRASGVNSESTSPVRLPPLQGAVLVMGTNDNSREPLPTCCIAARPAHTQSLLAFPPFSASFAGIGMGVGEEIKKGNYPNIGNWKYFKK